MTGTMRIALCTVAVAAATLGASPARADGDATREQQAKRLFTEAWSHMEAKDYEAALARYRASLQLVRHPRTLYNIATCEDKLGREAAAADAYAAFLEAAQPRDKKLITHARQRLARLRARSEASAKAATTSEPPAPATVLGPDADAATNGALVVRSARPGARVAVDGTVVGATAQSQGDGGAHLRTATAAGVHHVEISLPGSRPWRRRVSVGAGSTVTVDVRFAPAESTARRAARWSLLGVGAAGVVAGSIYGGLAVRDVRTGDADMHARGKRRATVSNVLLATGVVSLVGGWLLSPADSPRVTLLPEEPR